MGYAMDSRPETGNRQYGVDIYAHTKKEILLCVVKQGNLSRKNWDTDPNSVRQSLNEIRDTYIRLIQNSIQGRTIRVAVVTNGVLDDALRPNWEGYVAENTLWQGNRIEIVFWGIDELVSNVQQHLLNEYIFDSDMQGYLRKALYFIGEGGYHRQYFEYIVDSFLDSIKLDDNLKSQEKRLAGVFLATQMIAQYAEGVQIYKIAIMVTEYLIIRYWRFLLANQLFEKQRYMAWLHKFLKAYEKWNEKYYAVTVPCSKGPGRIPTAMPIEQRVILYEVVGYWTSYAYYLSFQGECSKIAREKSWQICNSIIDILNHYPQIFYPPYDGHIGIISAICRLLLRHGRNDDVNTVIEHFCETVVYDLSLHNHYPAPDDSFETAVNIEMGLPTHKYESSAFWGTMLQWIVLLNQENLYQALRPFFNNELSEITKCTWFLRGNEEVAFYDPGAMNKAGEGGSFDAGGLFSELKRIVEFVLRQYEGETFSYEVYSFQALEFIVCRYYNYLPRTCVEQEIQSL